MSRFGVFFFFSHIGSASDLRMDKIDVVKFRFKMATTRDVKQVYVQGVKRG